MFKNIKRLIKEKKLYKQGKRKNNTYEFPIKLGQEVKVGRNVSIGRYSYIISGKIYPNVQIGRYCSFALNVAIRASDHPINWLSTSSFQFEKKIDLGLFQRL